MFEKYSLLQLFNLVYFKIRTFFLFKNARLIRFPFRVRGKRFISIGNFFTTGFNCRIDAFKILGQPDPVLIIGNNVQLNDYVHIAAIERIEIHESVLIASKVFITDHNHGQYSGEIQDAPNTIPKERRLVSAPVIIEKNVWIGEFVAILPGVRIGEGSIVGTMSVITKDIPPYSIVVGAPGKVIKKYNFELKEWIAIKD